MQKTVKVPFGLLAGECQTASLVLDGGSVIGSCIDSGGTTGTMFLEQHVLLMILRGKLKLSFGKHTYRVDARQMILLRKATLVSYEKEGSDFWQLMFCISDQLLHDFLSQSDISYSRTVDQPNEVCNMSPRLVAFAQSLRPYFDEPSRISAGLLRLKVMEMFYDVADTSQPLFLQMLQLRHPVRTDLHRVIEDNLTTPVTLADLAYLSGRSLSSFKREFQRIYGAPPAKWIREQRLEKARELLSTTPMTVTQVCYSLGFENLAHFSRIFKQKFGIAPSDVALESQDIKHK